jgi:magnesium-transporting ATPase (P-type)
MKRSFAEISLRSAGIMSPADSRTMSPGTSCSIATSTWSGVIAVMVVLSISLGFIQEHRSNNAVDKLRRMVSINATVRRPVGTSAIAAR